MSAPLNALASFPSLSLADLDATWSMTRRYDTKFIMERSAIDQFLTQTSTNFAVLEIADQSAFTYQTTYFDTPDLLLHRDHAQGRSRRIKVRARHYVESNRTRLEVGKNSKLRRRIIESTPNKAKPTAEEIGLNESVVSTENRPTLQARNTATRSGRR